MLPTMCVLYARTTLSRQHWDALPTAALSTPSALPSLPYSGLPTATVQIIANHCVSHVICPLLPLKQVSELEPLLATAERLGLRVSTEHLLCNSKCRADK